MTGAVKLNTAGGGSVVVQPASSIASDVTVNVPSVSTTLVGTDTTQTLTNKTLTTPNIDSAQVATVSGTAPLYMCRAWVTFNGTGTVSIRASGNVSSITDEGTGVYLANFAAAMPDVNYCAVLGGIGLATTNAANNLLIHPSAPITVNNIRLISGSTNANTLFDISVVNLSIFR